MIIDEVTGFFFEGEGGIGDDLVTGVQTCALPISTTVLQPMTDWAEPTKPTDPGSAVLKQLAIDLLQVRRQQKRLETRLVDGREPDEIDTVYTSSGYAKATPRVSVVMPLYNHEVEVLHALESLAASDGVDYEVVIL